MKRERNAKMIRKASAEDINRVAEIYEKILTIQETAGGTRTGWIRGMYPTRQTAADAVAKGTLFVCEEDGRVVAAAKIDPEQVPEYAKCQWRYDALGNQVMVLHTLVVDPDCSGNGYGGAMIDFYEKHAFEKGCRYLRMDTNKTNVTARRIYGKRGYSEAGIVTSTFNGIPDVSLVCLEKKL